MKFGKIVPFIFRGVVHLAWNSWDILNMIIMMIVLSGRNHKAETYYIIVMVYGALQNAAGKNRVFTTPSLFFMGVTEWHLSISCQFCVFSFSLSFRFTLPFIGLSVFFTTASFLSLTFGHFCPKNKKIVEASMLILGGKRIIFWRK